MLPLHDGDSPYAPMLNIAEVFMDPQFIRTIQDRENKNDNEISA